ncbi:hypothetical protein PUN28_004840 [Cardiocondyla obscurior]|uniref:Uncharacterized protein n=1 Tax=Cardiocondyla obscurior TaxID=286306 RepID=A0AAW2GDC2_9HYME
MRKSSPGVSETYDCDTARARRKRYRSIIRLKLAGELSLNSIIIDVTDNAPLLINACAAGQSFNARPSACDIYRLRDGFLPIAFIAPSSLVYLGEN